MEDEKSMFEKNWDIFVLTGMPWSEIKGLTIKDRDFMLEKVAEAKERALEEQRRRIEAKQRQDEYFASQGLDPHGNPLPKNNG